MLESDYRTVQFNGLVTAYLEAGQPDAPVVLLLHDGAYGSDALSCWGDFMATLGEHYRVIAPDFFGYGRSAKVYDFELDPRTQRLNGVRALCEALGVQEAVVVGASFGGSVALMGAAAEAGAGLRFLAGVSISGTAGPYMKPEIFARSQNYIPTHEAAEDIATLMTMHPTQEQIKRRLGKSADPAHRKSLGAARFPLPGPAAASARSGQKPIEEILSTITIPFLFVAGAQDPMLEEGWHKELEALLPNGTSVLIDDARHLPQIDQPTATAEAIVAFLKNAESPTAQG